MTERDPLFLSVEEVVALQDDQLRLYGGSAGIRDDMRLYDAMIALSSRALDKPGLARLFRELAVPNPSPEEE